MPETSPSLNVSDTIEYVEDALQGLELEPHETSAILSFANEEVPHLQSPETSYFILGSYRDPYLRRLRIVQNELDKRLGSYPFLLGDLRDVDIERLPTFRIRFALLASYTDYIVAVYEQDAGGEVTELGKISETPYFARSYVLPKDYAWMTEPKLKTTEDVFAAAITIYYSDDLSSDEMNEQIKSLIEKAQANNIDVTKEELIDRIEEREENQQEAVSYSWVHLNEFRLFELHGQCFPWSDEADLRKVVEQVP